MVGAVVMAAGLVGCADVAGPAGEASGRVTPSAGTPSTTAGTPTAGPTRSTSPSATPSVPRTPSPTATRTNTAVASMTIQAIGVRRLRVVPYTGTADDRPGTDIQDRGVAASPRGKAGGVGPGDVGNYIITAHRTTHGRPFGQVPELRNGDHVLVTANGFVYDYVISRTMTISFRKPAEKAQQNAAVPGRPGVTPTRP